MDRDDVMLARDVAMEILEEEMSDAVSDPLRSSFEVGRVMAGRSSRRPWGGSEKVKNNNAPLFQKSKLYCGGVAGFCKFSILALNTTILFVSTHAALQVIETKWSKLLEMA